MPPPLRPVTARRRQVELRLRGWADALHCPCIDASTATHSKARGVIKMEALFRGALFAYEDEDEAPTELRGLMAYSGSGKL